MEEAVQVFVWGDGLEDPEDESAGLVKRVFFYFPLWVGCVYTG